MTRTKRVRDAFLYFTIWCVELAFSGETVSGTGFLLFVSLMVARIREMSIRCADFAMVLEFIDYYEYYARTKYGKFDPKYPI